MSLTTFVRDHCANLIAQILPRLIQDPRYFELWQAKGIHALPVHYYNPIPDTRSLQPALWQAKTEIPGVNLNTGEQLQLLQTFGQSYRQECQRFPKEAANDEFRYHWGQTSFGPVDAAFLYGVVRHFKPRRIIEVGSGFSTLVALDALDRNQREGSTGRLLAIEPYPRDFLKSIRSDHFDFLEKKVQEVPLSEFRSLGENDVLFIDSSHVCKIGSDVQYEILEILPRLSPGVIVHFHDIFLPAEYPEAWIRQERRFWNEQYLLQAFLSLNDKFSVLLAGYWLHLNHPEVLKEVIPHYTAQDGPGSFWMRKVK